MVRDRVLGGGGGGGGVHLLIPCPAVLDRIKDDWEFVIDPEVRFIFLHLEIAANVAICVFPVQPRRSGSSHS